MLNKFIKIIIFSISLVSFNFSAFAKDPIKIAMIEPMSGPLAAIGLDLIEQMEFFAERVNGEFKLRRDFSIKNNQKVLIIEDVITTGKSSLECEKLVLANKGIIVGYACIIDRSNGKSSIKNKIVSQIKLDIPTYSEKDIPDDLSAIKAVKPGSRNL